MLEEVRGLARDLIRRARVARELLVWGGERREQILLSMLGGYYDSLFRRQWVHAIHPPHFYSHRINAFRFGFGAHGTRPETFYRGFFSSETIRVTDRVLDIGCGDGFFTKRFLSARAQSVDAVDIEPSAIEEATRFNRAPNISYTRLDAVNEPFPRPAYDVVIWDGAIGHFGAEDSRQMFGKINGALAPGGIFAGSESLGREGEDHLQFFETLDDLRKLFAPFWKHVLLRQVSYSLDGVFVRREAFWRCSNDPTRLAAAGWVATSSLAHERAAGAQLDATS